ncbi:MAG TPA: SRPBCC domain-containing protein [Thermoplasmata archaeon]|nr:SRPBCC domain-containing protein [Thermoplasmata archaeon]
MAETDLDPILIQVTIPLPIPMIFGALTEARQLALWMCDAAEVEPRLGGPFALHFPSETVPFDSDGEVTRIQPDLELGFTWVPPPPFDPSGAPTPGRRSEVYWRLQESPEGIDITLEHAGFPDTEAGGESRSWHFRFWEERLRRLKEYLLKAAYG